MPTFIKRKIVMAQQRGQDSTNDGTVDWTDKELTEMREKLPSRFITVSESHAAGVIRPQDKYQEVEDVPVVTKEKTLKPGFQAVKPRRRRKTRASGNNKAATSNTGEGEDG